MIMSRDDVGKRHAGESGNVLEYQEDSSTYLILLRSNDLISVRGSSLCQINIEVTLGRTGNPEIDNKPGKIVSFDESERKYGVQIASGTTEILPLENINLPPGTLVRVNLPNHPCSGILVKVLEQSEAGDTYIVTLANGKQLQARPSSLLL